MCINTSKSSELFQDCLCAKTKHFSVLQKYSWFFDRLNLITWSLISLYESFTLRSQVSLKYAMHICSPAHQLSFRKILHKELSFMEVPLLKSQTYQDGLAERDSILLLVKCFDIIHVDFRTGDHNPDQCLVASSSSLCRQTMISLHSWNLSSKTGFSKEVPFMLSTHVA